MAPRDSVKRHRFARKYVRELSYVESTRRSRYKAKMCVRTRTAQPGPRPTRPASGSPQLELPQSTRRPSRFDRRSHPLSAAQCQPGSTRRSHDMSTALTKCPTHDTDLLTEVPSCAQAARGRSFRGSAFCRLLSTPLMASCAPLLSTSPPCPPSSFHTPDSCPHSPTAHFVIAPSFSSLRTRTIQRA